jgi:membrane protein DedA with SNARE-associated domain
MHAMMDPAVIADWLATWGYVGIFAFVFIGNLGIPVPEETVMLAAGFLAGRDILDVRAVYGVAMLSAVSGDCCGFAIGRTGGQALMSRLADNFEFVRLRYGRLQIFFRTHGSKAVFMARFIAGVRFLAGPMAGAAGMPFFQFLGWNVLGAIVWCSLIVTIGYLLGDELYRVVRLAHLASRWTEVIALLVAVAIFLIWLKERRQEPVAPSEP